MARMSPNAEIPGRNFGDISHLTNFILDSGATCHIPPEISDFIPGSSLETDQYIEVEDSHFFTEKNR